MIVHIACCAKDFTLQSRTLKGAASVAPSEGLRFSGNKGARPVISYVCLLTWKKTEGKQCATRPIESFVSVIATASAEDTPAYILARVGTLVAVTLSGLWPETVPSIRSSCWSCSRFLLETARIFSLKHPACYWIPCEAHSGLSGAAVGLDPFRPLKILGPLQPFVDVIPPEEVRMPCQIDLAPPSN